MNLIGGLFAWFGFVRDLFVLGLMCLLWAVIAVGLVFCSWCFGCTFRLHLGLLFVSWLLDCLFMIFYWNGFAVVGGLLGITDFGCCFCLVVCLSGLFVGLA